MAGAGEKLAGSKDFVLCDPPYNVRGQCQLENTRLDVLEPNDMDVCCDLPEKLVKSIVHGHLFCSALPFS